MKKFLSLILILIICFGTFGCGNGVSGKVPEYNVSVSSSSGGSVTADASKVEFGDNVVLTVKANDGYVLACLKINGNEVELDGDSYTIAGAMRDYNVEATFIEANVNVTFKGEGTSALEDKKVSYGTAYGKLPRPEAVLGKRFVGWSDSFGNIITESTTVRGLNTQIELTSTWEDVAEEEKELLKPITITTAYYDMAATNYGLVWHTKTIPVYPVVLVQQGNSVDKSSARIIVADYEYWFWDEYVCTAVIDNLDFNTTYTAILGDYSADVWSKEYTFTTREEYDDEVEFLFISDTQENYLIENMGAISAYNGVGYLGTTYSSQVLKEATTRFPDIDFLTHGGDVVNYGIEAKYWEQMMGSYEDFLFNYPLMVTTGNHSEPLWYAFGSKNNIENKMFNVDWSEDIHASSGMIYSFNYGPLHLICLRSNDVFYEQGGVLTNSQISWLINDVKTAQENPNIKWTIAMMHEGPIIPTYQGTVNSNTHTPMLGGQLLPLFDELGIDMLLYGHNHYLDTTHPIIWDETAAPLPYTDNPAERLPNEPLAKALTVKPVTTQTEKYTFENGAVVDKYIYPEGSTRRGTVYHQCMTSGMQMDGHYKYSDLDNLLAAAGGQEGVYRMLASGAVGCLEDNGEPSTVPYSGYSYVNVTPTSLTVLSYGVDARGVYEETDPSKITNHSIYIDGFMLTK